jgi:hypothetical protein
MTKRPAHEAEAIYAANAAAVLNAGGDPSTRFSGGWNTGWNAAGLGKGIDDNPFAAGSIERSAFRVGHDARTLKAEGRS